LDGRHFCPLRSRHKQGATAFARHRKKNIRIIEGGGSVTETGFLPFYEAGKIWAARTPARKARGLPGSRCSPAEQNLVDEAPQLANWAHAGTACESSEC
jgi:hypothetical protein